MLVVDAGLVIRACVTGDDLGALGDGPLHAPPLMWSEARSSLHAAAWRGEIDRSAAEEAHRRLQAVAVVRQEHPELGAETWRIADELGWTKTYDAEYVALASLLGCRLVTIDVRLRRGADRLGFVVAPLEL